jgi:hypothetical protein
MSEEEEEFTGEVSINCTFRPFDSGKIILRQVALGHQSLVLIEPEMDDDENVVFKIDATGLDRAELAEVLSMLGKTLGEASDSDVVEEGA